MSSLIAQDPVRSTPSPARTQADDTRLGPLDVLFLSAWCGVAGGWLEVAARVVSHSLDPTGRLYQMSRHFVWLTPLANLTLFVGIGLLLALATRLWPRSGARFGPFVVCTLALLPAFYVVDHHEYKLGWSLFVYRAGWFILAGGIAALLVPRLEQSRPRLLRGFFWSFPLLLGLVPLSAGVTFGRDALARWREASRALPPAGSPNVLLIVWDTVRADHLSLHGYSRATTPVLERLAQRGIRFDEARATAPWTLPSHASMFTGRHAHELASTWLSPLGSNFPTLAGYLSARGYATSGFVGNKLYCSYDTGLASGFTHYEDHILERLTPLRTALLVDLATNALHSLRPFLHQHVFREPGGGWQDSWLERVTGHRRRDAQEINRAFLKWLGERRQPGRPFFAFLNYYDAHSPYLPPAGTVHRFGLMPRTQADFLFLDPHWTLLDKMKVAPHFQALARDSYDNCIAYLDEQLGDLLGELKRRGVLEQTLLVVTSDHGEGFGEHQLFDHGESLYRSEIHVPLLFVLPGRGGPKKVVTEMVSLRDLPATIVELLGQSAGSPFPGRSLGQCFGRSSPGAPSAAVSDIVSELAEPNPANPNAGRSPTHRGPLVSLAEGDFVYIRNKGDGTEELFNERDDPYELSNRASAAAMQPLLRRMRDRLKLITADLPAPKHSR